jgi:hypothetical protein
MLCWIKTMFVFGRENNLGLLEPNIFRSCKCQEKNTMIDYFCTYCTYYLCKFNTEAALRGFLYNINGLI